MNALMFSVFTLQLTDSKHLGFILKMPTAKRLLNFLYLNNVIPVRNTSLLH